MSRAIRFAAGTKKRLTVLVVTLLAVGGGVAFAYFTSLGAGTGAASVGSLTPPTITSAIPGAGTATLQWSFTPPVVGPTTYYTVSRATGEGPIGGTCTGSLTVTSCTDSGLAPGTYYYTVTVHWASWTAPSAEALVVVASGPASKLAFVQQPTNSPSGSPISPAVTVAVEDAAGNVVTSDGSTQVTVTLAPSAGILSGTTTRTVASGVATFADLTVAKIGSYTLTASSSPSYTGATSSSFTISAVTKTASASGNWCDPATWTPSGIPTQGTDVTITGASTTITIQTGCHAVANSVTLGDLSTNTDTLTFQDATSSLTVEQSVNVAAPSGTATRDLQVNAGTLTVGGSLNLSTGANSDNAGNIARVTLTTGTVTVAGDLVFNAANRPAPNAANSQLVMSGGAGTFNLAGAFTINAAGTLTPGTSSTFNFNGTTAQTIPIGVSSVVYNNLTVGNTSAGGATLSAQITTANVKGALSVTSGGTLNNGGFAITLNGGKSFSVADTATFNLTGTSAMVAVSGGGTKTFGATSTVNYAGATQTVSAESYGNLNVANGSTKTAGGALTIRGNLTVGSGTTFAAGAGSHLLAGDFTNNGTFTTSGAVTLNGTGPQSVGGTTTTSFHDLTVNKSSGTATLAQNENVGGVLTVTAGTLDLGTKTLAVTGATTVTGMLNIGNLATFTESSTFTVSAGGTTNVTGGTATITGAAVYNGLMSVQSGAVTTGTGTADAVGATGTLSVSGGTYTGSTKGINVSGTLSVSGGTLTTAGGITVSGTLSVSGGTLTTANKLDVKAAVTASQIGGTIDVKDFDATGNNFSQSGSSSLFKISHDLKGPFSSTGGTVEFDGSNGGGGLPASTYQFFNVVIDAGVIEDFANAANTYSVAGNWTNNGTATLTGAATTVVFDGAGPQTIGGLPGGTTFFNLTIGNGTALSGVDTSVAGTLALNAVLASGANTVKLTSTTAPTGTSYVDGALQRPSATAGSLAFPVGAGSNATPLTVTVAASTVGTTLTVRATGGEDTAHGSTGISQSTDVNSYWTLTASGGNVNFNPTASIVFNYPSSLVDVLANPATFRVARWNGTVWAPFTPTGTPTSTSTTLGSVAQLTVAQGPNDFVIGNP